ncbi:MAG: carboxypeptidase regulatory-like domain-containing protein [Verrucomicrobiae bacterium]|nr:carboxypeptidase regulatory-like domain-containing protein [Verrucomicrobiae bacterium]
MKRLLGTGSSAAIAAVLGGARLAAATAVEVGPAATHLLPRGKEADGIVGDFVLRNDLVEATVSHNASLRRANMSTFYGTNGITPGCLYDLGLRGHANDQLVIFAPLAQQGPVSYVRVDRHGDGGAAVVETVVSAPGNEGLHKRHAYHLEDGMQGILIASTVRNEGMQSLTNRLDDRWTRFASSGEVDGIVWADAEDPADRAGYAYAWLPVADGPKRGEEWVLQPGEELEVVRFLAVGRSPAEAAGVVAARLGPVGRLQASVRDASGEPVPTARFRIPWGAGSVPAYPDHDGTLDLALPPGTYEVEVSDIGRPAVKRRVTIGTNQAAVVEVAMEAAAMARFDIRDEFETSIPCKVQFLGIGDTPSPNLGPKLRAHGCADQYHSERGDFRVQLPPGAYRIVVTRGPEFGHLEQEILLEPGGTVAVAGVLRRLVDTSGWVSCDYHNHTTESGDNTCGVRDRLINLAAEHIEFAPTTEHNRFFDWGPHIEALGLAPFLKTVPGVELTGSGQHMNSFPFEPVPHRQDNGAPMWNRDPRITAITLRGWQGGEPLRWIQLNHPDLAEDFNDRDGDGEPDGGFAGLDRLVDALETQNFVNDDLLAEAPMRIVRGAAGRESVRQVWEFIWLQLLNRGTRLWATAVADAHAVHGNGAGGWRVYLPSSSDDPARIDWRENVRNARAGRGIVTSGPFLQVACEDGTQPGDTTMQPGMFHLHVRVQCTDWMDINRVQVLVNGRQRPDLNFTRASHPEWFGNGVVRFDRRLPIRLSEDAHLIVVAVGEGLNLQKGFGTSDQAGLRPCAYNNPIFVDVDGDGFKPNGDLLGWPLPTGKRDVDTVRAALVAAGLNPETARR